MRNRARILVADDERNLCRVLVARLARSGYRADAVHNGTEALRCLEGTRYDLVLLDLSMPVMGGLAVLEEARQRRLGVSVIVMTAYDSPDAVAAALAAGADAYITKPFDLENVVGLVESALAEERTGVAAAVT